MSVFVSGNSPTSVASSASTSQARSRVAVTSNSLVSFIPGWTLVDLDPGRADQERRAEGQRAQGPEQLAGFRRPGGEGERDAAALERLDELLGEGLGRGVL